MKYDALLFGNGLTLNLLGQIKRKIPSDKHYLLSFDMFMHAFLSDTLPKAEERSIFFKFYKIRSNQNLRMFEKIKDILRQYYLLCDGNIEKHFGLAELQTPTNYDYPSIKSLMPALYNIWFSFLNDLLVKTRQQKHLDKFYESVRSVLTDDAKYFTTNFDLFADKILNPDHLHGSFVEDFRHFYDCKWIDEGSEYMMRYLWGWNGIGKWKCIYDYATVQGVEDVYDWAFFTIPQTFTNVLIYGMSFQCAGWVTEDFKSAMPKYEKPKLGAIIDEHILLRLDILQNQNRELSITFAYYSDQELEYYRDLVEEINLKNVSFIRSNQFLFSAF